MKRAKIFLIIASLLAPIALLCTGAAYADTASDLKSGVTAAAGDCSAKPTPAACTPQKTINDKIATIVNILSSLVGVIAVIMVIVGGFRYITSGGSSDKVSGAKNTIIYALIGLVIVALAQVIVRFVLNKAL